MAGGSYGLCRGLTGRFLVARTRYHTTAAAAHNEITITTARAEPSRASAKRTKTNEPKMRIQDQPKMSGSNVHRFIPRAARTSRGTCDVTNAASLSRKMNSRRCALSPPNEAHVLRPFWLQYGHAPRRQPECEILIAFAASLSVRIMFDWLTRCSTSV